MCGSQTDGRIFFLFAKHIVKIAAWKIENEKKKKIKNDDDLINLLHERFINEMVIMCYST